MALRFGVPVCDVKEWPAHEIDLWRVWEHENGPVWSPEVDRWQRAAHAAMYANAHGAEVKIEDYLPPWQREKRRDKSEDEIVAALDKFTKATK